jgi:perosamine synthetase
MIVCDADIYGEVFMVKDLKPLSWFHVHSNYTQIMKVLTYMLEYSSSLRGDHYRLIRDLFKDNGREDTSKWEYLVNYGARTSLDLFLQAKNYPEGSEILMTAISTEGTIETVRGANYSGRNEMKIVPIDIEWETMGPSLINVKSKVTNKTKAIVVSYMYGIIYDIKKIAEYCHKRGIDVIEDASEAFSGISTPGSQYADFTLLSFGMLRHYTSFGGAIWVIRRDNETYNKMLEIEKSYRKERTFFYLTRVFKAFRLMTLLNSGENFFTKMGRVLQQYKVLHYVRKPIWKLRQRISLPWLRLLYSKLSEIDPVEDLEKYKKLLKFDFGGVMPGCQAMRNNYYLYPVIFREPKKIIAACRMRGIQALAGPEVHWLVKMKTGSKTEDLTPEAARILKNITLLPINIETSEANIQKVHSEVVDATTALNRGLQISPIRYISKI